MSMFDSITIDEQASSDQLRILVVEDDSATRRLYRFLLANSGFTVYEAEDGRVALDQLARYPCDLMITDLNMPRMDGIELISAIRQRDLTLYIIVITAFGTSETEKLVLEVGADAYLAKPFDFEALVRRVQSYAELRQRVSE
jgi:two-component system, chemotaxis family, chemotaxis protein CheY